MDVELRGLSRWYGRQAVVQDLSIGLAKGELIALLGPSGCGKTTTLRMVAGFIAPNAGSILFQGRDVTRLPPHERDTGLVFQNYALFPHLSVTDNVAFGLKRRGVSAEDRARRIDAILRMLRLEGLERRLPRELSGGQQQRVAVARALVINPALLLLDEPFSNLDAKLRESTGIELRKIQRTLGITAIFVTHDQNEAMAIADKIAVMNHGRVEQLGTPAEIYERPLTRFVAEFIGSATCLKARVLSSSNGEIEVAYAGGTRSFIPWHPGDPHPTGEIDIMIRPERIRLSKEAGALTATVDTVTYQGAFANLLTRTSSGEAIMIRAPGHRASEIRGGDTIGAVLDPGAIVILRR